MNEYKEAWDIIDSYAIQGIAPKGNKELACLLELIEKMDKIEEVIERADEIGLDLIYYKDIKQIMKGRFYD